MHYRTPRIIIPGLILLGILFALNGAIAQSANIIWPGYHSDNMRTGLNPEAEHIGDPSKLNLVWVFPRDAGSGLEEVEKIVDETSDHFRSFSGAKSWENGDPSRTDYYVPPPADLAGSTYRQVKAVTSRPDSNGEVPEPSVAIWECPVDAKASYKIFVWVPSNPKESGHGTNASKVVYTVYDDFGARKFEVDQADGGYWRLLSAQKFSFKGTGTPSGPYRVEMTNAIDEDPDTIDEQNIYVLADAIKFEPTIGQSIYSSPVSVELLSHEPLEDIDNPGEVILDEDEPLAVVYVGTVDDPFRADVGPDMGSVYCINSVTPINQKLSVLEGSGHASLDTYKALAKHLGDSIWRYPDDDPSKRHPLEGPIEGGVYSTPLVTYAALGGTDPQLVCFVTGSDMQVYALDALTGDLLWKGPGVTVSEDVGDPTVNNAKNWDVVELRDDAFGGSFRYKACTTTGGEKALWEFHSYLDEAKQPDTDGLAYNVYAWLPTHDGGPERISDAVYAIYYEGDNNTTLVDYVRVDMSLAENQGRWVRLGQSYYNVKSVELENKTEGAGVVVADAVMIVPNTIGSFGYCSPVADTDNRVTGPNGGTTAATKLYVANSMGRIMEFDLDVTKPNNMAPLNWIYPAVRTTPTVSGSDTADKPALGSIAASPSFYKDSSGQKRLYIAVSSLSDGDSEGKGKVYCLNVSSNAAPDTHEWVYPGPDDSDHTPKAFLSSPTVDPDEGQILIGSNAGVFYCLDAVKSNGPQLKWKYPEDPTELNPDQLFPLGSFRYSTPAVAKDSSGKHRAWVGSMDTRIYSFDVQDNASITGNKRRCRIDEDGNAASEPGIWYLEPRAPGAIQGSVAIDGNENMYIGSMGADSSGAGVSSGEGYLSWFKATTGSNKWSGNTSDNFYKNYRLEGSAFSSPVPANVNLALSNSGDQVDYVYIGCSEGYLYAFSPEGSGAWGGEWTGGEWPFEGNPNDDSRRVERFAAQDIGIQFDLFNPDFYKRCTGLDADPKIDDNLTLSTDPPATTWLGHLPDADSRDVIVSEEMKLISQQDILTFVGKTDWANVTNEDVEKYLREVALDIRTAARLFPSGGSNTLDRSQLFLEWGETIYVILWNLPEKALLDDTRSISLFLTNASPGSTSGSQVKYASRPTALVEYTVLDKDNPKSGTTADSASYTYYDALNWPGTSDAIKRCFALVEIKIDHIGPRAPVPGPGWMLTADIRVKDRVGSNARYINYHIPLAKLELVSGRYEPKLRISSPEGDPANPDDLDDFVEQPLGINNPLAIKADSAVNSIGIAWPVDYETNRSDPEAHFNGNAAYVASSTAPSGYSYSSGKTPFVDLGRVSHGATSTLGKLGVMDRSAIGTNITGAGGRPSALDRFRVNSGDLQWLGGVNAITSSGGTKLPWELGPGSVDYPHLYSRYQHYNKAYDDLDPSKQNTTLPPIRVDDLASPSYDDATMVPDWMSVSTEVPRFQPANETGFERMMQTYVDANLNKQFDSGLIFTGRPSTYQEVYREFKVGVKVPPDPKIEVEEQVIDIGRAPHGLGWGLTGDYEFSPYNTTNPKVQQWFKKVTIKNTGNMNLINVGINPDIAGDEVVLRSDQSGIAQLLGSFITSSLDYAPAPFHSWWLTAPFKAEPYVTTVPDNYGYTLTKSRVGDPDPTVLTIPDARKVEKKYNGADLVAQKDVKVSVRIPPGQPIGTYSSWDKHFKLPFVRVAAKTQPSEPYVYSFPSFEMKVSVRESRLTGGVTDVTLPHIDLPPDPGEQMPKVGDTTPAAYRDSKGNVRLFWSSNRLFNKDWYPEDWGDMGAPDLADFANAPWFLQYASLRWNSTDGWIPVMTGANPQQWWKTPEPNSTHPYPFLPDNQWPSSLLIPSSESTPIPWRSAGEDTLYSVRHYSPFVTENIDLETKDRTPWLTWVGSADVLENSSGSDTYKVVQENRVFYTPVSFDDDGYFNGDLKSLNHDPYMAKRSPCMSVFFGKGEVKEGNEQKWLFWQGGEKGRWSLFGSAALGTDDDNNDIWSDDIKLRTPDCLVSVSAPNAVHHRVVEEVEENDSVVEKPHDLIDMVYAGVNKVDQSSDIILNRYQPDISSGRASATPLPFQRVFSEELERDPSFGFFKATHLGWIRLGREGLNTLVTAGGTALLNDRRSMQNGASIPDPRLHREFQAELFPTLDEMFSPTDGLFDASLTPLFEMPYVWVQLPENYRASELGEKLPGDVIVSATDGSAIDTSGNYINYKGKAQNPQAVVPAVDEATGVYTYSYQPGSLAADVLGSTLIDFSAGIVRFTEPLAEEKNDDGTFDSPKVYADYTPQALRFTTDPAVDNSPRAIIERTPMHKDANPGIYPEDAVGASVDRLWVFWRKAGAGVGTSTIYYKTYRIGVDLTQPHYDTDGNTVRGVKFAGRRPQISEVTNVAGPVEVDKTGTKIFFTQPNETYSSMRWAAGVGKTSPVTIEYTNIDGKLQNVEFTEISWVEEMPEQSLFGYAADGDVNEGSIWVFADLGERIKKLYNPDASIIWVFWTSTRGGTSDLYWETLSPSFFAE